MSLCIKVEKAFARYLLKQAEFLIADDGSFIRTDTGLKIKLASGFSIDMPVVADVDKVDPLSIPNVVCSCRDLSEEVALFGTKVFQGPVVLTITSHSINSAAEPDILTAFEFAARELAKALYRDDLAQLLTAEEPDFTCIAIAAPRGERHSIDKRSWQYEFSIPVVVAHGDLSQPPPP